MNTLVTGATGKVGSRLVPALLTAGHTVRILVRDSSSQTAKELEAAGAHIVVGEILQPKTLEPAVKEVDAVIHLAAFFRSPDAEYIRQVNVVGTQNLATAALRANKNIRFIFASTSLVYQNNAAPAKETDETAASMMYPASKIEAEKWLLELHKTHGFDVRIARFGFVYGTGDPHLQESGTLFERWQWHPAQRLHLVHHADIAQGLMLLLRQSGLDGETYNLADDAPVTAQEVLALTGQQAVLADPTTPLENPWRGIVTTAKARQIGFRPLVASMYTAKDLGLL